MPYYLMYSKRNRETRRDEHFPINIKTSTYFPVEPRYRTDGCTLQEIDLFTTQFNDERELRRILFREGLLTMRDFNRPLSARSYRNNTYTKVPYDFLYQKDLPYLMDPNLLITRIEDKLYIEEDYHFIIQLANTFDDIRRYREVSTTLPEVRTYAQKSIDLEERSKYFEEKDKNNDKALVRMIKLLIYTHTYNKDGSINYGQLNYSNFHKMLAFINFYEQNQKTKKAKEEQEKIMKQQKTIEEEIKNEIQEKENLEKEEKVEEQNVEPTVNETVEVQEPEYEYYQDNLFDLRAGNRLEKYVNGEFEVIKFPEPKKRVLKPKSRD